MAALASSEAPALEVMIRITLRKSTDAPVVVGQLAVVHHLQQDVEHIRVRLLDLVEQQHAMRMLVDPVGQQPALVEADIARRRADQARDGVLFHVFRHVEAQQLDAEAVGQLLGDLGLADAGGAGEEVVADRLFGLAQTGAGQLDRRGQCVDRLVLTEDDALQRGLRGPSEPRRRPWRRSSAGCGRSWRRRPRSPWCRWSSGACDSATRCCAAPASSITSMALSGSLRSLM